MEHLFYLGALTAVWIIVALAANLVIGYTGMMAMGQAAYLGAGAYVAAILNILLGVNFYLALLAAERSRARSPPPSRCCRCCASAAFTSRWRRLA